MLHQKDTFCSHSFDYACLRRLRIIVMKSFKIAENLFIQSIVENGWWKSASPTSFTFLMREPQKICWELGGYSSSRCAISNTKWCAIGVQAMTSCVVNNLRVTMIYEPPKKQNIFALLEITFSNLW